MKKSIVLFVAGIAVSTLITGCQAGTYGTGAPNNNEDSIVVEEVDVAGEENGVVYIDTDSPEEIADGEDEYIDPEYDVEPDEEIVIEE